MNTKILVSFLLTGFFIGIALSVGGKDTAGGTPEVGTVSVVDGVQMVAMQAKGGYSPAKVKVQAGLPTVLKMESKGTYDCSASLQIPQLEYSAILPATGETEIQIPAQESGTVIQGLCGMGMYGFQLIFE